MAVSEIVDFRSMVVVGEGDGADRALTQVKAVDDAYPLVGALQLDPPMSAAQALEGGGAVMDGVLVDRLGLAIGDRFRLGLAEFTLRARLLREPDSATGGFGLGPRSIVRSADLAGSQLLEPGTLFETAYRLRLPAGADLAALERQAESAFRDKGMRWQDSRRAAPGAERFVERMGSFLVLVGLAGLAVGGVGISAAVRAYLEGRTETIAILKSLGADGRTIMAVYLIQIGVLSALGIAMGLVLGAGLPLALAPVIEARMPFPVSLSLAPAALAEAALYGALTAALFTLVAAGAHPHGAGGGAVSRYRAGAAGLAAGPGRGCADPDRGGADCVLGLVLGAADAGAGHGGRRDGGAAGAGAGGSGVAAAGTAAGGLGARAARLARGAGGNRRPARRGKFGHPVAGAWPVGAGRRRPDRFQPARGHRP